MPRREEATIARLEASAAARNAIRTPSRIASAGRSATFAAMNPADALATPTRMALAIANPLALPMLRAVATLADAVPSRSFGTPCAAR